MRRRKAKKIAVLPDPKFNDVVVTKFVNNIMLQGKKGTAFDIFYNAIDKVSTKTSEDGLEIWRKAFENVTPAVEVRSRRVGGATFQIPTPIRDERKSSMAMKWLIGYARSRNEKAWLINSPVKLSPPVKVKVLLTKRKKTFTEWLTQTKPSLTSECNQ
jgi:small subunit ribosomal protein S7